MGNEQDGTHIGGTPKAEPLLPTGGIVNGPDDNQGAPHFVGAQSGPPHPTRSKIFPRNASGPVSDGRRGET